MKDMIVGKIRDLLTGLPITDEPTLVYFLFLVCELGECDEAFELTVPNFHFYSSWILKKGLDRSCKVDFGRGRTNSHFAGETNSPRMGKNWPSFDLAGFLR